MASSDTVILSLGVILAALYLFRDQLFAASKPPAVPAASSKTNAGGADPRDFIAKMKETYGPYRDLEDEKLRDAIFATKPSSGAFGASGFLSFFVACGRCADWSVVLKLEE